MDQGSHISLGGRFVKVGLFFVTVFFFVISRALLLLGIVAHLNSTLGKLRQENHKILASIVYIMRPCLNENTLMFNKRFCFFF